MKDTEQCAEMGNIYISSEQIIQEVQKFRCLYDPADPDHKDRDVMRDAWLSVTQAVVGEPWANLNSAEKNEAVKEAQRRWRNMRDYMRKSVLKGNSSAGISGTKKRPYMYFNHLTFLLETESFKELNDTDDNEPNHQTDEPVETSDSRPLRILVRRPKKKRRTSRTSNDRDDTSATHEADELSDTSDSRPAIRSPRPQRQCKHRPIIHTMKKENNCETEQSPIIVSYNTFPPEVNFSEREHLSNAASQKTCMPDLGNPDWCFMLSLLPRVGALRSRDKLDFQIKVMELLQRYEVDDSSL